MKIDLLQFLVKNTNEMLWDAEYVRTETPLKEFEQLFKGV